MNKTFIPLVFIIFTFSSFVHGYSVYMSSGEVSGEQLGKWYVQKLRNQYSDVTCNHDSDNSLGAGFIGVSNVYTQVKLLWKAYQKRNKQASSQEYDEIVLIDLPLVHLPLLRTLKNSNLKSKITYIAPPEMWLWGRWGLDKWLNAYADNVVVIFPFEKTCYEKWGLQNIHFLGFPYLDELDTYQSAKIKKNKILLMPGSRSGEIDTMMPILAQVIQRLRVDDERLIFVLPLAHEYLREKIEGYVQEYELCNCVDIISTLQEKKQAYQTCICAITKPGTSTLELALCGVPMVIACKVSLPMYYLCKAIIQASFVGLPNLIAQRELAPELMQYDCTPQRIYQQVHSIIDLYYNDYSSYQAQCSGLKEIHTLLV